MKILMVCLGNICRSPMAEGILRHKIKQHNLDWEVSSCGTGAWHVGEAPDKRAQKILKKYGIDISTQKAQKLDPNLFNDFDLIFAMDSINYSDVIHHIKNDDEKIKVELIMNLVEAGKNQNIPDPYFDDNLYEVVYEMLDKACDEIISKFANK